MPESEALRQLPRRREAAAPGSPWQGPWSERAWGGLFVAPALVLLLVLAAIPIVQAVWLSLHRMLPIFAIHDFIGLVNYRTLLADDRFWAATGTTAYFTVVSVALELLLGLLIALLVQGRPLSPEGAGTRPWLRVIMLVPWAIPTVVSARIWEWLYQPDYGVLNHAVLRLGVTDEPVYWLASPAWSIHAAILMDVWKTTPFAALLLLAGLSGIPRHLHQAAVVDGASPWQVFRRITLPLLWPAILIVLAFRTMDAFRVFDAVFVLTGGGPGNSTETLSIYAYKTLFQTLQFGYGAAVTTAMFLFVMVITAGYVLAFRRRVEATA